MFEFHEINTADFPLYNADLEQDKPAIIETHAQTIRDSNAVLFFSPEYNYSIPGHLKNAIDWLSRVNEQPFDGKKASIIGGWPGTVATARMQYELRKVGVFLNINFLNKPEVMIAKMYDKFDDAQQLTDDATHTFLATHAKAISTFIQER